MQKITFDLTGKAVDCSGLLALGDAGKEIFRALKVVCDGRAEEGLANFASLRDGHSALVKNEDGDIQFFTDYEVKAFENTLIQPVDVLGQARIDAAMDGATLVFEGGVVPRHSNVIFYADGTKLHGCDTAEYIVKPDYPVVAYKPREEKQPSIQSRILSEKMGFKELCPVCSPKEWEDREAETYDELRDAHLELVRENMALAKENEALAQRIKNLHRAINDAKAALDE